MPGKGKADEMFNNLSGRSLSLPVQYQRAHPVLREGAGLAVLGRGGKVAQNPNCFHSNGNSRSIYSMNSDDSASHDSEEELDALELDQN